MLRLVPCPFLIVLLGLIVVAQEPVGKRHAIPAREALERSEALIKDIFKEDFSAAQDPTAKAKLAGYLFQQGKESRDDLANRYQLYQYARRVAAQAGDTPLALSAVEELAREFDLDGLQLKAQTVNLLAENVSTPESGKTITELALQMVANAIEADSYDNAATLIQAAEIAARKSKNIPLVTLVQKKQLEIVQARKSFSRLEGFLTRLKNNPDDCEANLELGRYFALVKNRWERALPYLARGSDIALKAQAQKDLASPETPQGQLAVADGWWDLALQQEEPARLHLQQRAAHWYDRAALKVTGLSRTKALRRSEQVSSRVQPTTTPLASAPAGEVRKFEGHTQEVRCVAFSPDGRHGVSASYDSTARVWDLATGKDVRTIRSHTKELWGCDFLPGSRQFVTSSWDATVRLWDLQSGTEVRRFTHPKDVNGVTVSRDGRYLLTGCDDHGLRLWDVTTGQEIRKFSGATDFVYGVIFSPDGRQVASGSKDGTARVYDLTTGQLIRSFSEHTDSVNTVAFSPDSLMLYTCGDNVAHQWQISTGKELKRFGPPGGRINALALSHDGRRLLTGGDDYLLRLWDTTTGKELQSFKGHNGGVVWVALSPDDRHALSGSKDNTVRLWSLPPR